MRQFTQRFAAFVLIFALTGNVGSKAGDLLPQLRKDYENCVYYSVRLQGVGGTSEAMELAFQACQSEERAITEHLKAVGMAPATVEKAWQAFRLRLQKTIR